MVLNNSETVNPVYLIKTNKNEDSAQDKTPLQDNQVYP
jgi:hypothetical protein